jgi:hypothetical protein
LGRIAATRAENAMSDVTRLLAAIEGGDPGAAARLLPLVYNELRTLAAARSPRPPATPSLFGGPPSGSDRRPVTWESPSFGSSTLVKHVRVCLLRLLTGPPLALPRVADRRREGRRGLLRLWTWCGERAGGPEHRQGGRARGDLRKRQSCSRSGHTPSVPDVVPQRVKVVVTAGRKADTSPRMAAPRVPLVACGPARAGSD